MLLAVVMVFAMLPTIASAASTYTATESSTIPTAEQTAVIYSASAGTAGSVFGSECASGAIVASAVQTNEETADLQIKDGAGAYKLVANSDGTYYITCGGKYLVTDSSEVLSFSDTAISGAKWKITAASAEGVSGFTIMNTEFKYDGKDIYLEYFNGFKAWTLKDNLVTKIFVFSFYTVDASVDADGDGYIGTKPVAGDLPRSGDSVVIYNDSAGAVLGPQDSNETSPSMSEVKATVDGLTSIDVGNGGMIFNVTIDGSGYYTFESGGKYLASGDDGNDAFMADAQSDNTLWQLAAVTGGYTIMNKKATFTNPTSGKKSTQYLEYYNSSFKTYSYYSDTQELYVFNFYQVEDTYNTGFVINPKIVIETTEAPSIGVDYVFAFSVDDITVLTEVKATYAFDGAAAKDAVLTEGEKAQTYSFTIPAAELAGKAAVEIKVSSKNEYDMLTEATSSFTVADEPLIVSVSPAANEATGSEKKPEISAVIANVGASPKVTMAVDNVAVTPTVTASKVSYKPTNDLTEGKHVVTLKIVRADKKEVEKTWSFFVGEGGVSLYFGQLHSHTKYSDGAGTLVDAFNHAKDADDIDYLFVTDHSNNFDTTDTATQTSYYDLSSLSMNDAGTMIKWEEARATAASYTDDNFIAGYGYEMTWSGGPGHTNTFNTYGTVSRNNSALNNKTGYAGMHLYNDLMVNANMGLDETGAAVTEGVKTKYVDDAPVVSQLNHPGITFGTFDTYAGYTPTRDSVINLIEVGNGEGAIGGSSYWPSYSEYDIALAKGWHVAPTNNQDNHKGNWGDSNTARVVIATEDFTEGGLYKAMSERHVYATEDQNLSIYYYLNDAFMGSIIPIDDDVEIETVHINASISDPDGEKLGKVQIIGENGLVLKTYTANSSSYELDVTIPNTDAYYYIKVTQADGNIAVTAPVWVGEATPIFGGIVTDSAMSAVGESEKITATVNNAAPLDYTISKVEFSLTVGDKTTVIETLNVEDTVASGTEKTYTFDYTRTVDGRQTISVIFYGEYNGKSFKCSASMTQKCYLAEDLLDVGIDYGHGNFYVSGGYTDNMSNFIAYCAENGVRVNFVQAGEMTYENIKDYKLLVLTVPFDKGALQSVDYTPAELEAIEQYAANGGNLIVTTKSDRLPKFELISADVTNGILEAVGANVRAVDGIIVDNEMKSNEAYRIYFSGAENTNPDHVFTAGAYTSSNAYGTVPGPTNETGFQLYNAGPIEILEGKEEDVTVLVKGYDTTWGASYGANFTGSAYVPNYETDTVTVEMGKVNIMTYEELEGGGWLVTSGCTFFSNYDIKDDQSYTNRFITKNILDSLRGDEKITKISNVHKNGKEGEEYTVEGIVTANASGYDQDTAFFDCIYIQDETRGINLFPVAGNFRIGQKVRAHGGVTYYCGEIELNLSDTYGGSIKIISDTVSPIEPEAVSAKVAMADSSIGNLMQVEGIVTSIHKTEGDIDKIYVRDTAGNEACLFINAYIMKDYTGLDNLKIGNEITGVGIGSRDVDETSATAAIFARLRVRDRSEIKITDSSVNVAKLFKDVAKNDWFHNSVQFVVEEGLFNGISSTQFAPNATLNRAMVVTVLYRMAGEPDTGSSVVPRDVVKGSYYEAAVAWGMDEGIIAGYPDGTFRPTQDVTREEMATFLYRYAVIIGGMTGAERNEALIASFPDAGSISSFAKDAVQWCISVGIINGKSGKIDPAGNATRAEFATIAMRYVQLATAPVVDPEPADPAPVDPAPVDPQPVN
jgi:hypothetical protein